MVLACMAPANGSEFSPVRMQKLIFLVENQLDEELGDPLFSFSPHLYGPFDVEVYNVLEQLEADGHLVILRHPTTNRTYQLTTRGQEKGDEVLASLDADVREYIIRASKWVQRHSFATIVSAIYKDYPDMKTNSVFRDSS